MLIAQDIHYEGLNKNQSNFIIFPNTFRRIIVNKGIA